MSVGPAVELKANVRQTLVRQALLPCRKIRLVKFKVCTIVLDALLANDFHDRDLLIQRRPNSEYQPS